MKYIILTIILFFPSCTTHKSIRVDDFHRCFNECIESLGPTVDKLKLNDSINPGEACAEFCVKSLLKEISNE